MLGVTRIAGGAVVCAAFGWTGRVRRSKAISSADSFLAIEACGEHARGFALALTLYRLCKIMQGFGIRQEGCHPSLLGLRNCQDTLSGPCLAFDLAEFACRLSRASRCWRRISACQTELASTFQELASTFQVAKEDTNYVLPLTIDEPRSYWQRAPTWNTMQGDTQAADQGCAPTCSERTSVSTSAI